MRVTSLLAIGALLLGAPSTALAQEQSDDELARQAANPVADLISLPLQNNLNGGLGPYDRSFNILNIQPVIPLAGGKVITRTILPILWPPDVASPAGSPGSGLGDIVATAFYVPPARSVLMVGFGPVLQLPTGGEVRGTQKWGIGPSAVVLAQPGDWTFGLLANNVWSFAGSSDRDSTNNGLVQAFIVRQLGRGWYVNSAPILTVNWKAAPGQKWVVPIGVGAGKLLRLGRLPVNLQVGYYRNVVKPDVGPDWQLRLQAQVLVPASLLGGGR